MKVNPFYIVWGIVSLLLVGGAGAFLFTSKSSFDATKDIFEDHEATIKRLEKKAPFPDAKSVEQMEEQVAAYGAAVDELFNSLSSFQRELRTDLRDADFQKLVLDKLNAFGAAAKAAGMTVTGGEKGQGFYFGMDAYRDTLPSPKNVPLLDYQLEAIDRLLAIMVESGVENLISLIREPLPTELAPNDPDPTAGQSVVRYALRVRFVSRHDAFQSFINKLANDKDFFYLLRVIRVDNSSPDGPLGDDTASFGDEVQFTDSDGNSPAEDVMVLASAIEDLDERITFMAERGYAPISRDAKILLGDETVEVFALIDVARFPTPKERGENDGDEAAK